MAERANAQLQHELQPAPAKANPINEGSKALHGSPR